jgi:hypothetical protein
MTKEQQIEDNLIAKLSDLKYRYRADIMPLTTLKKANDKTVYYLRILTK